MIEQKGLGEFFHFAGAVDQPELVYRASDVYLQPTCSNLASQIKPEMLQIYSWGTQGPQWPTLGCQWRENDENIQKNQPQCNERS